MNQLVAAPAVGRKASRAFSATSRGGGERLFRRAARHSRLVRLLRIAIPIGVTAAVGLVLAAAYFNPAHDAADISLDKGKLMVSGSKIAMERPRLTGFTNDSLPYELTAQVASQDLANPGVLDLQDISARIQTKDEGVVTVSAATGSYNVKADTLRLVDNIVVESSSGYQARLEEAVLEIKKGVIVSERKVKTRFPNGTLDANRLDISESGAVVLFSQGVEMVLTPGATRTAESTARSP